MSDPKPRGPKKKAITTTRIQACLTPDEQTQLLKYGKNFGQAIRNLLQQMKP